MRLTGQQYYWLILSGLVLGLILATYFWVGWKPSPSTPVRTTATVLAMTFSLICYYVVALEIWEKHGLPIAVLCHAVFPLSVIYWVRRIKGTEDRRRAT